jgi:hypothetical protein
MKKLRILWPWHRVKQGQGFFIPCLNTKETRAEGLGAALKARVFNAHAVEGVHAGRFGVLFFRGVRLASLRPPSVEHTPYDGSPNL